MTFDTQTKTELAEQLQAAFLTYSLFLESQDEKVLFERIPGKWNMAQQTDHLTIANIVTTIGFAMPKPILKTMFGTSNRKSHCYEEVVFRYQSKLTGGAKASFAYQPRLSFIPNKNLLITLWNRSVDGLQASLRNWNDEELDQYVLGHPILGKMTMREMLCFTIYHVRHHLGSIQSLIR